jgi:hypothetical protein
MANTYITNHSLGVDEITGLEIELRVREVFINAQEQKITIKIDKVLVSPTGVEMKNIESLYYDRFNSENNKKYDQLDASPLGLGIKQMLNNDLLSYPNLLQL